MAPQAASVGHFFFIEASKCNSSSFWSIDFSFKLRIIITINKFSVFDFFFLLQPILNGRDSVRKVLETFQQRGGEWGKIATQYFGPVIENFTCDKTIYTAVEVRFIRI